MRVCFLSMESLEGYVCMDDIAIGAMRARGWTAEEIPWTRADVDWGAFDVVLVRSTWDYWDDLPAFLVRLEEIDRSPARLENALPIIRWNVEKTYLRDLAAAGVRTLPTLWADTLDEAALARAFATWGGGEIVVKPVIGAGAVDTFRLGRADDSAPALAAYAARGRAMIQPFAPEITAEGEYSLFYFGGVYSHAILKTPKSGDFRVQEEYGGVLSAVVPEAALRRAADALPALCPQPPFVLRADYVRRPEGFALMELEAVEPSLYFNLDPQAAPRFADALARWMADAPA